MAIADIFQQAFNFLIVFITIIFIIALVSPFLLGSERLALPDIFNDACAQEGGVGMLLDLNYDSRSTLFQFMTSQRVNMRMTYPRNTFDILSALFDQTECNLEPEVNKYAGLYLERKNARFLETCVKTPCFCTARTAMDYLTFENLELTACFPRLYAFARTTFDTKFNELTCTSDEQVFEDAVMATLMVLKEKVDCNEEEEECDPLFDLKRKIEARAIIDCYNMFLDLTSIGGSAPVYDYDYIGIKGLFTLTLDNPSNTIITLSGEEMEAAISQYYELTKAGFLSDVQFCTEIPNSDNCYCPFGGNFMISKSGLSGTGILLGIAGSKSSVGANPLSIGSLLIQVQQTPDSCMLDTQTTT
jgi:hypothetical protein